MKVYPLDWRYGAAIVGLVFYLKYFKKKYILEEDYLEFDEKDITEEDYLEFAEEHFSDYMYHREILNILDNFEGNIDVKNIKKINDLIQKNSILKKVFEKIKYDGNNTEELKKIIKKNRLEIIKKTYITGKRLYSRFCQESQFFKSKGKCCRIKGYYIDIKRKLKSVSYRFDSKTFVFQDEQIFDFIPFAFSQERDSFFINANLDLKTLVMVNEFQILEAKKAKKKREGKSLNLLEKYNFIKGKIEYDVEVIVNSLEKAEYFETVYLRKISIWLLKCLSEKTQDILGKVYKIESSYLLNNKFIGTGNLGEVYKDGYLYLDRIVVDSILNLIYLDDIINFLLKIGNKNTIVNNLIYLNELIYSYYFKEREEFELRREKHKIAQEDAQEIKKSFLQNGKTNKLRVYEQRLVTAISLGDGDKVKDLMLHLSSYTQKPIRVLIPLCEDFEKNKNLAYIFINTLGEKKEG